MADETPPSNTPTPPADQPTAPAAASNAATPSPIDTPPNPGSPRLTMQGGRLIPEKWQQHGGKVPQEQVQQPLGAAAPKPPVAGPAQGPRPQGPRPQGQGPRPQGGGGRPGNRPPRRNDGPQEGDAPPGVPGASGVPGAAIAMPTNNAKPRGVSPPPPPARDFGAFKLNKRSLDAEIEAELNAVLAGADMEAAADAASQPKPNSAGEGGRKKGRVVSIHGKDVFIDIPGGRSQGMLPLGEFEGNPPSIGDEVEFMVDHYDSANGMLVLTREGAAKQVTDWSGLSHQMLVEAKITGMNKNQTGYTVEVNGIRGFMPLSQADMYRIAQPETLVNQKLKVQVIELDPVERNLIVSRRNVQEAERMRQEAEFWATLAEGQVRKGKITSIKPFGAFVNLGGADGLIPIGELSWQRVGTVEEVVKLGQDVEVQITRLDPDTRKIGLSLRSLQGNPWDDFAKENRPGSRVAGKVTRIADFGAFVELAPGIEGLIHVSELSSGRVRRVSDAVKEGQDVTVQILTIDTVTRRIGLSLKAITSEAEAAESAAKAAEAETDKKEAAERMANRKPSGTLRGGIGGGAIKFVID